jgi:energy-converting hydrogenase Eha subunit C
MHTIITNWIVLFLGDNDIVLTSRALNKVKLQHLGENGIIDDLDFLSYKRDKEVYVFER